MMRAEPLIEWLRSTVAAPAGSPADDASDKEIPPRGLKLLLGRLHEHLGPIPLGSLRE
jgi:hypothetical protein